MKKIFYYLVGTKMLETKLEISKLEKENTLNKLFDKIDKQKNLFDKGTIDPSTVINLYDEICEKLNDIKYENIEQKNIEQITPLISNTKISGYPNH